MPERFIWDKGAQSVTATIARVGENLVFNGRLFHACGENAWEEGMFDR